MVSQAKGNLFVPVWIDDGQVKPLVDASGQIEVVQQTPADLRVALHGFDGSNWKKLQFLWGYNDRISEHVGTLSTGAATTVADSAVCPANTVWVITTVAVYHLGGANRRTIVQLKNGGSMAVVAQSPALAPYTSLGPFGSLIAKEGDYIRGQVYALANGKWLYLNINGYSMRLDY